VIPARYIPDRGGFSDANLRSANRVRYIDESQGHLRFVGCWDGIERHFYAARFAITAVVRCWGVSTRPCFFGSVIG